MFPDVKYGPLKIEAADGKVSYLGCQQGNGVLAQCETTFLYRHSAMSGGSLFFGKASVFPYGFDKYQDFCDKYARARERQADFMAAQTVDIADDTSKDNSFAGSVAVARSRLRIDARKWLASKLAPKKYGDKIDATLQGPDGGPIQAEHIVVEYIRQKDKKDPV